MPKFDVPARSSLCDVEARPDPPGDSERRWSSRKALRLDVLIFRKRELVARGISRDVGLEGMFVELPWHPFAEKTALEAEFTIDVNRQPRGFRVPVIVVHVLKGGVGFMFAVFDQRLFRSLEAFFYAPSIFDEGGV